MAFVVLVGLIYVARQYMALGRLPGPFHLDPSQSLMDLYNTAYWANRPGAYKIWHTVYPPLPLIFAQFISNYACYAHSAYEARTCDPGAAWFILLFYLLNIPLVYMSLRRSKRETAAPRTFALCLGLPMLYGLELANLIIPCFTCFVLAEGGRLRPLWARQLCRALAFNFKLYLLVVIIPPMLRLRIRWLMGVGAAFIFVYLVTVMIYGSGTPVEIFLDLISYAHNQSSIYNEQNHVFDVASKSHYLWSRIVPNILRFGEFVATIGILFGILSKDCCVWQRLSILSISLICSEAAIHTQGFSADYTQIFLIFLIFIECDKGFSAIMVTVLAYMLCISGDFTLLRVYSAQIKSFFSGELVGVDFGLTVSQFVRPILIMLIQAVITGSICRQAALRKNELGRH